MRVDMILPVAERIRKSVLSIEYEEVYALKILFEKLGIRISKKRNRKKRWKLYLNNERSPRRECILQG